MKVAPLRMHLLGAYDKNMKFSYTGFEFRGGCFAPMTFEYTYLHKTNVQLGSIVNKCVSLTCIWFTHTTTVKLNT